MITELRTSEPAKLATVIGQIARDLADRLGAGDVAALRRLKPSDPSCAPYWRLVSTRLEPAGLMPDQETHARAGAERRWAAILAGMATMAGMHQPRASLGRGLAEADISELRVLRLLRAHDEALEDALRVTTHALANKAKAVDWTELAQLVLTDGAPNEEAVRRRIARDFYRTEGN